MILGSLFDGSGGFPLAGTLCGITPVWASEVEPYPIAVTRTHFPHMRHLGDISKINGAEIQPVDIITFGSPCQDLSNAGKRAGLKHKDNGDDETTRSGLFMEAVRIITEMWRATNGRYPTFVLWENVPGAFSSNNGEDFRTVLESLVKIVEPGAVMPPVPAGGWAYADSYVGDGWSLAYRVFNAQYWGTAQRRRRLHLILDLRGQRAREILFEREGLRGYFETGRTPWKAAQAYAQGSAGADDREGKSAVGDGAHGNLPCVVEPFCKGARPRSADDATVWKYAKVSNTLNTFDLGETRCNELVVQSKHSICLQGNGIDRADTARCNGKGWKEDISYTLNTIDRPAVAFGIDCRNMNENPELYPTLLAKPNGGQSLNFSHAVRVQYIVRRLTPTEWARLQGFPDRWGDIDPKTEFTDEEFRFWSDVRNTHAAINGKQVKDYTPQQMVTWYNKLHTDSAEYKMWGNGIALPPALYVMQGIAEASK